MTIDTTTLASLTWLVGIVSSVLSVIVMLNPLRFVLEVTSNAETTTSNNNKKNISVPTFVALFGNFLIWNAYGLITRNSIVFVQNMLGVVFSAFYLYRLYFCKALAPELKVSTPCCSWSTPNSPVSASNGHRRGCHHDDHSHHRRIIQARNVECLADRLGGRSVLARSVRSAVERTDDDRAH
jgi:uncharacterized protein with PQ loop repeat